MYVLSGVFSQKVGLMLLLASTGCDVCTAKLCHKGMYLSSVDPDHPGPSD